MALEQFDRTDITPTLPKVSMALQASVTSRTMKTRLVLKLGQHSTLKWTEKYGDNLLGEIGMGPRCIQFR